MAELASRDLRYERKMLPKAEAKAFFGDRGEPLKVELIEGEGRARRLVLHDRGRLHRLLHRPARPVHGAAEGVQGALELERLLEGGRTQPADAADLRYRVLQGLGTEGPPAPHRAGEGARPPEARQGTRAVHVPPLGAGSPVLAGEGHDPLPPAGRLHARHVVGRGLPGGAHPAPLQQGALGDVRPLGPLPGQHVPGAGRLRRRREQRAARRRGRHRGSGRRRPEGAAGLCPEGDELSRPTC